MFFITVVNVVLQTCIEEVTQKKVGSIPTLFQPPYNVERESEILGPPSEVAYTSATLGKKTKPHKKIHKLTDLPGRLKYRP